MAKHKFIAKVALRGEFDVGDGLDTNSTEVQPGQEASTEDKKLYDSLLEQGYIKTLKEAKADDQGGSEDGTKTDAPSGDKAPAVKTTDKTGNKKP